MTFDNLGAWWPILQEETNKPYFKALQEKVEDAYRNGPLPVYPPEDDIFNAFLLTNPDCVSVVILGQDPYHGTGQAHGLSFSVKPGVPLPKSLQNIYKELQSDIGCPIPSNGCLEHWAREGVLLLNTTLTVYEGKPDSHSKWGWQKFTRRVLEETRQFPQSIVFILWGSKAQKAAQEAEVENSPYPRLCISSAHPSPLSVYRGFWGSHPFSKANAFLKENGAKPIDWTLP